MSFFIITSFITAITSILLGVIVYSRDKKNPVNKLFGFYTLAVFVWSFSYSIWLLQDNFVDALFWSRILNIGATLIPIAYLHWVLVFLKQNKTKKIILIFGYILTFIFLLFSFSGYYIKGVVSISIFSYWPQANWLYFMYLAFNYCGMTVYGSYLLYKKIKAVTGPYKEQIKYAFWGSVIGFIGGATNFPLMLNIDLFPPFGNPLAIVFPIFFAYAIVRHRLMDIKIVLRRSSVYLISLLTIIILAVLIKYVFSRYFTGIATWADLAILILALSIFPPIKNYCYQLANKYFFTSLYDSQEVIMNLSDKLRSTLESNKIYKFISDTFVNSFHAKAVGILIHEDDQKNKKNKNKKNKNEDYRYTVHYNKGFDVAERAKFSGSQKLCDLFLKHNQSIIVEEIKNANYKEFKKIIDLLIYFKAEIVIPLNIKGEVIGLIILGQKESGDMYNDEDLKVLKVVGAQAAIAVENALLYGEQKNFAIKLKREVQKATSDLRAVNKQLKKLDVAKSEFISIASHQLRTPLTIIKGYISMMIEGSFGKLSEQGLSPLEKVYDSNERLIQLVENLLNVSRIESGKLQFDFVKMQLEDVVESAIEELAGNAKKKGLRFEYKKPDKPLPRVNIDQEKIRQVVINLIDNAIKYTKNGTIKVKLEQTDNIAQFCVSDTGMGINSEDLPNLFKKFSRGKGVSLVHTEGTGLGLYVGKIMIEAHHGKIWAESDGEEKGSKFCFEMGLDNGARD